MLIQMNIMHEILVIGWIRKLFKTKEFKDLRLLPMYLLKMICGWYDQEMIHWLNIDYCDYKKDDICNHQKIALKHILSNL